MIWSAPASNRRRFPSFVAGAVGGVASSDEHLVFDHKRRLEVSAWSIMGCKKTRFNSKDFGVIVIPTYAAAHHT